MICKTCSACCTEKPLSGFFRHGKSDDGHSPRCKVCTKSDMEGRKFWNWTVLERGEDGKAFKSRYLCECMCGERRLVYKTHLVRGNSKSCGCLFVGPKSSLWGGCGEISGTYWDSLWRNAVGEKVKRKSRKDLLFTITIEYCWQLFVDQGRRCSLSGEELVFGKNQTASLDRVDSLVGYTPGNVQWVHKDVNMMKNVFSQARFLEVCEKVCRKNQVCDI